MNNRAKLMICLKLYEFVEQTRELTFTTDSLSAIDKLTFPFENANDFVEKNKEIIRKKLERESRQSEIMAYTDFIELNMEMSNPMYIVKESKKIQPLFQNILFQGKQENLENLIKKRLKNKWLKILQTLDDEAKITFEYESIFKDCDRRILAKIEADLVNEEDIHYIWQFLRTKNRFYAILRFLLLEGDAITLAGYFLENFPFREYETEKVYTRTRKGVKYRLPYKDD